MLLAIVALGAGLLSVGLPEAVDDSAYFDGDGDDAGVSSKSIELPPDGLAGKALERGISLLPGRREGVTEPVPRAPGVPREPASPRAPPA